MKFLVFSQIYCLCMMKHRQIILIITQFMSAEPNFAVLQLIQFMCTFIQKRLKPAADKILKTYGEVVTTDDGVVITDDELVTTYHEVATTDDEVVTTDGKILTTDHDTYPPPFSYYKTKTSLT